MLSGHTYGDERNLLFVSIFPFVRDLVLFIIILLYYKAQSM